MCNLIYLMFLCAPKLSQYSVILRDKAAFPYLWCGRDWSHLVFMNLWNRNSWVNAQPSFERKLKFCFNSFGNSAFLPGLWLIAKLTRNLHQKNPNLLLCLLLVAWKSVSGIAAVVFLYCKHIFRRRGNNCIARKGRRTSENSGYFRKIITEILFI